MSSAAERPAEPDGLRTVSLRRRVVRSSLLVLVLIVVALGVFVDVTLQARLSSDLDDRLVDRAQLVDQLAKVGLSGQNLVERTSGNGVSVRLTDANGSSTGVLAATPPKPGAGQPPSPPAAKTTTPTVDQIEKSDDGNLRYVTQKLSDGSVALLSADAGEITDIMNRLIVVEAIGAVVALAGAGLVLRRTARGALAPLDQVTTTARSIAAGDRGRRLQPDRPDTELGRTAVAFDEMLDQLEGAERDALASATKARGAEEGMRTLLADAAHELRTPLAVVRATSERLLRRDPGRLDRETAIAQMVQEVDRASGLVDDVLTMRQAEAGVATQDHLDLARVAEAEVARTRERHAGARVELMATPTPTVGDPAYLGRILSNLLDNAVRAVGPTGTVRVVVGATSENAVVDVVDDGPGIPPAEHERVFERLVRLDAARSREHGGAGLGLPIARALARAQGGDVVVVPVASGATLRLWLPRIRSV